FGFNVVYGIHKKLDYVIKRGKDCLKNALKKCVVYKIDCENCNVCYIGKTKRHIETRVKEHRQDIKKHDNNNSVVSRHRICNNHNFDCNNVKILHQEDHRRKREIAEMCYIKQSDSAINLQNDTESFPCIYHFILKHM
ncbi:hypothetical protein X777_04749, partial [Ooceraea biroi]